MNATTAHLQGRRAVNRFRRTALGRLSPVLTVSIAVWFAVSPLSAAPSFASPVFARAWDAIEEQHPNYWGALTTAQPGFQEAYLDAPNNLRLVQYFDKGRMELNDLETDAVTSGLLATEMRDGRIDVGGGITLPLVPARINIAGDPGTDGPTYADLADLPAIAPMSLPKLTVYTYDRGFTSGAIDDPHPIDLVTAAGPDVAYVRDPGGHYAQYVYRPFLDFIAALPAPITQTTGYPIAPFFFASIDISGVRTTILIQAFERRVLTYNPHGPTGFQIEFANTGVQYYRWRYLNPLPAPTPIAPP